MATWKWIVAALVLVAAAALCFAVLVAARKRRERKRIQGACAAEDLARSGVFVVLLSYEDTEGAARTLCSLFERAHCPLRIYVGLCEVHADGAPRGDTVLSRYQSLARTSRSPFCLKDHVRVLRIPASDQRGVLSAAEQVERLLYRGEAYVCSVQTNSELMPNWDKQCMDALLSVTALQGRGAPRCLLTTLLPRAGPVGAGVPGTFSALLPNAQGLQAFAQRKQSRTAPAVAAAAWSSSFSFAPARRMRDVPYPRLPDHAAAGWDMPAHDLLMTVLLVSDGWRLFHPGFAVGRWAVGPDRRGSSLEWRRRVEAQARLSGNGEVFRWLGVSWPEGASMRLNPRAQLGLVDSSDEFEVDMKLGSLGELYSIQARLELVGDRG